MSSKAATPASTRSLAVIWARLKKPVSSKNAMPSASWGGEARGRAVGGRDQLQRVAPGLRRRPAAPSPSA